MPHVRQENYNISFSRLKVWDSQISNAKINNKTALSKKYQYWIYRAFVPFSSVRLPKDVEECGGVGRQEREGLKHICFFFKWGQL